MLFIDTSKRHEAPSLRPWCKKTQPLARHSAQWRLLCLWLIYLQTSHVSLVQPTPFPARYLASQRCVSNLRWLGSDVSAFGRRANGNL